MKALRVAARFQADLQPPLGEPGGPCQVVRRIKDEVTSPELQRKLVQEVMHGDSLSNPEAAKIYDLDLESIQTPLFKQVVIGPHAQYRMDLRGITVKEIQETLSLFAKMINDLKSQHSPRYKQLTEALAYGEEIEWMNPKNKLYTVFVPAGKDKIKLISTYWKGSPDPRLPPGGCSI